MAFDIKADRILIDGVSLECAWYGPAPDTAPTIVMLHEGLGCVALWRDFPERLAERTGCGVFVYSRAGYGASDPIDLPRPLTYMEDEAKQVVPALLHEIGFQRGILLGHSDGASIAAVYAGSIEDHRVRGVVLFAPHFFTEDLGLASIAAAGEAYETGNLRPRLERYHGANVDCAFHGWHQAWLAPGFRSWDILDAIAHIRVPILMVQGRSDEYGTLAQIDKAAEAAYCPVETLILDECGHAPHLDQSEATLNETAAFIERLMVVHDEARPLALS
jgi:pimeloyl-ACP methyl ester carboxylesterase